MPTTRIADVIAIASSLSGVPVERLKQKCRKADIVWIRQAISYVAWSHGHSLPLIGRALGGQHHTTIIHSVRQAQIMAARDDKFAAFIAMIAQEADAADPFLPGWHAAQTVPVAEPVLPVRKPKPKPDPSLKFDAPAQKEDAGHRFHRGIAKGSVALLAALQAA